MARPSESVVHGSKASPGGDSSPPARPQDLPSIDRLLRAAGPLVHEHGHTLVARQARALIDERRAAALAGTLAAADAAEPALAAELATRIEQALAPRLKRVLNLTGTVIHTNLGRALLAEPALEHVLAMMAGPNNLEYDLASGGRGDRDSIVEELLCTITGAEAATVVNNNAGAVLLTIGALAAAHPGGKEVIVSRGELVEIGGAFRMPDVMAAAGATLVEVGTTNRTHPRDYEAAISPRTALLMKVHTSNYAVQGFTAAVDEAALAAIAHAKGLPLASDLGAGSLIDLAAYGLPREPTPQEKLAAGCDVVTFSGDKLLGGPQAGLIVGGRQAIQRIRSFPMKRALRVSRRSAEAIRSQAQVLQPALADAVAPRFGVAVVELMGQIGSGSLPVERLPSAGLAVAPVQKKGAGRALDDLSSALRALPLPVIGRIADDRLLLDLRCLEDSAPFVAQLPALRTALGSRP
jgi:L-seryl-tRNA(Ser) seleniumtransferase